MGEREKANETLRSHVKLAADLLSDDDESNDWQAYEKLSVVLIRIDDDINALAAWSLLGPIEDKAPEADDGEAEGGDKEAEEADEANSFIEAGGDVVSEANCGGENGEVESGEQGTETKTPEESVGGSAGSCQPSPEPFIRGPLSMECDGHCNTTWGYAHDLYYCRDCLDVQFEIGCLEKL